MSLNIMKSYKTCHSKQRYDINIFIKRLSGLWEIQKYLKIQLNKMWLIHHSQQSLKIRLIIKENLEVNLFSGVIFTIIL